MNRSTSWLTIAISAVVGILFIIWHGRIDLLSWIVIAMGILLMVPGIYNLIALIFGKRKTYKSETANSETTVVVSTLPVFSSALASICCVVLGLWMVLKPDFFVGFLAYLFAAVMIVFGVYQIYTLYKMGRSMVIPWYLYIVPIVMAAAGIIIICSSVHTLQDVVVLLTGILLVLVAINGIAQQAITYSSRHTSK